MSERPMSAPDLGPLGGYLLSAIDSPGFAPIALAVAFGAGALHACAPGHGKGLTAAYLVGAHGRHRDALLLGSTVAVMHTLSVVAVGLAWVALSATRPLDVEGLSEVLKVIAAAMVAGAGALLVRRRPGRVHHADDHHHHGRADGRRPGLVLLAASGGLLPSPAAFLVLLGGIFSGRTLVAVVLVLAFGLGMAVVLSAVGLATVSGRDLLARSAPAHGFLRYSSRIGPVVAAWGVLLAGCALTVAAVAGAAG